MEQPVGRVPMSEAVVFDATVAARLLEPVAGDQPCGPDLEYDPALIELQTLAAGKPEQQFGDKIIPGEEPDWPAVPLMLLLLKIRINPDLWPELWGLPTKQPQCRRMLTILLIVQ